MNVSEECAVSIFKSTKFVSGTSQSNQDDEKCPYWKVARTEANKSYGQERGADLPCQLDLRVHFTRSINKNGLKVDFVNFLQQDDNTIQLTNHLNSLHAVLYQQVTAQILNRFPCLPLKTPTMFIRTCQEPSWMAHQMNPNHTLTHCLNQVPQYKSLFI